MSRATKNVPSLNRGATSAATSIDRRVLPVPPGPESVRRRVLARRWETFSTSARPTNDVTWAGNRAPTASRVRRGGKSVRRLSPASWKMRIGWVRSFRRCSPRSMSVMPGGSAERTSSAVAADRRTWPPCPAAVTRAVSWSARPTKSSPSWRTCPEWMPMRTRTWLPSGQSCSARERCTASAALTAASASVKTRLCASPSDPNDRPPCSAALPRMMRSCSARTSA